MVSWEFQEQRSYSWGDKPQYSQEQWETLGMEQVGEIWGWWAFARKRNTVICNELFKVDFSLPIATAWQTLLLANQDW